MEKIKKILRGEVGPSTSPEFQTTLVVIIFFAIFYLAYMHVFVPLTEVRKEAVSAALDSYRALPEEEKVVYRQKYQSLSDEEKEYIKSLLES